MRTPLACLPLILGLSQACAADPDLADVYRTTRRAVVEILTDGHHSGSGCFVSADGRVVTAAHVIARPQRAVEVLTSDGTRQPARIVAVDLGHDLIVLQVAARDGGYPFVNLAAQLPPPGAPVWLCSSAAYRRVLLQPGTMARDDLTFEYQDHFLEVTQIAALIQEGTSGGAWINPQGELIGIQSGSVTVKGHAAGIANVAPVAAVRRLLDAGRHAATPTLGAFVDESWVLSSEELRRYPPGSEGLVVQSVKADGPADRAGFRKGDMITAWQGVPLRFRDDFVRRLRQCQPGDTVELTTFRPEATGTRTTTLQPGTLEIAWPP